MAEQFVTLDVDEALQRFSGNRQIFSRLLLRFLELNADVAGRAEDVVGRGQRDEIAIFFHSIKGGAANLSAKRLAAKSGVLENLANKGELDAVKAELSGFTDLFAQLRAAAADFGKP